MMRRGTIILAMLIGLVSVGSAVADGWPDPVISPGKYFKVYPDVKAPDVPAAKTAARALDERLNQLLRSGGHEKLAGQTLAKMAKSKPIVAALGTYPYKPVNEAGPGGRPPSAEAITLWSPHFLLVYFLENKTEQSGGKTTRVTQATDHAYALRVLGYLEHAHQAIHGRMKFKTPTVLDRRVTVFISDVEARAASGNPGIATIHSRYERFRSYGDAPVDAHIAIAAAGTMRRLFGRGDVAERIMHRICAHEFFHTVQYGYLLDQVGWETLHRQWKDEKKKHELEGDLAHMVRIQIGLSTVHAQANQSKWVMESTARWIEDKIVPYAPADVRDADIAKMGMPWSKSGWLREMPVIQQFSSVGTPSIGYRTAEVYAATYAQAPFLEYWTSTKDGDAVRKVWHAVKKSTPLHRTVVDTAGGAEKFQTLWGDFATSNFVLLPERHKTWHMPGLKVGSGGVLSPPARQAIADRIFAPSTDVTPLRETANIAFPGRLARDGDRMVAVPDNKVNLRPDSLRYFELAPALDLVHPGTPTSAAHPDLLVGVRLRTAPGTARPDHLKVAVAEIGRHPVDAYDVTMLPPAGQAIGGRFRVHRVEDVTKSEEGPVLILAHADGEPGELVNHVNRTVRVQWIALVTPPVVESISVAMPTALGVGDITTWALRRSYDPKNHRWSAGQVHGDALQVVKGSNQSGGKITVTITTSHRVRRMSVKLDGVALTQINPTNTQPHTWVGQVPISRVLPHVDDGKVKLTIDGIDDLDAPLDTDPTTTVTLGGDRVVAGWENTKMGDDPETHEIPVEVFTDGHWLLTYDNIDHKAEMWISPDSEDDAPMPGMVKVKVKNATGFTYEMKGNITNHNRSLGADYIFPDAATLARAYWRGHRPPTESLTRLMKSQKPGYSYELFHESPAVMTGTVTGFKLIDDPKQRIKPVKFAVTARLKKAQPSDE